MPARTTTRARRTEHPVIPGGCLVGIEGAVANINDEGRAREAADIDRSPFGATAVSPVAPKRIISRAGGAAAGAAVAAVAGLGFVIDHRRGIAARRAQIVEDR